MDIFNHFLELHGFVNKKNASKKSILSPLHQSMIRVCRHWMHRTTGAPYNKNVLMYVLSENIILLLMLSQGQLMCF